MPKHETRLITRTEEEDERIREAAARRGADLALQEVRDHLRDLHARLAVLKGIVSRDDLAMLYGKDPQTIKRWAERHGFERVDGPDRRKIYYDLEDVKAKVRSA
jgi:hypothetical protein